MAAGNDIGSDGNAALDELGAHSKSYSLFIQMMKWGTIISFAFGFFVVFVLIG